MRALRAAAVAVILLLLAAAVAAAAAVFAVLIFAVVLGVLEPAPGGWPNPAALAAALAATLGVLWATLHILLRRHARSGAPDHRGRSR